MSETGSTATTMNNLISRCTKYRDAEGNTFIFTSEIEGLIAEVAQIEWLVENNLSGAPIVNGDKE